MPAAASVLAIDIVSMAATLSYCNVRASFDHSIILLWQRHNLSHHIKSFSSISIHLQHILSHMEMSCNITHTQCNGHVGERRERGAQISFSHQRSHLVLPHCWVAVTLWSMLTLCFLHSYSHVHAWASRTLHTDACFSTSWPVGRLLLFTGHCVNMRSRRSAPRVQCIPVGRLCRPQPPAGLKIKPVWKATGPALHLPFTSVWLKLYKCRRGY